MYAWVFSQLPGPVIVRVFIVLIALAGIVYGLMEFVFPWLSQYSPLNDATMDPVGQAIQLPAGGDL